MIRKGIRRIFDNLPPRQPATQPWRSAVCRCWRFWENYVCIIQSHMGLRIWKQIPYLIFKVHRQPSQV